MKKRVLATSFLMLCLMVILVLSDKSKALAATKVGSWSELVSAVNDGEEEIKLSSDVTWTKGIGDIVIKKDSEIVIDLAGYSIDRGLKGKLSVNNGYVIVVQSDAKLTLKNSVETEAVIKGGANTGNGGGIYCEENAKLNILDNVFIRYNKAKNGGGIYLGEECELTLGACTIKDNDVTKNGGGIYGGKSSVVSFLGGLTRIRNNTENEDKNNDFYICAGMEKLRFYTWSSNNEKTRKKVYSDEFKRGSRIGILLEEISEEISEGYGNCNTLEASIFFFYNNYEYKVSDSRKDSEIKIIRNPDKVHAYTQTVLEVFQDGELKSFEEFSSFSTAFSTAVNRDGQKVITLGQDYTSDSEIVLDSGKEVTIDLNGHYIKRERNYETKKNGGVFRIKANATLTIRDSYPKKLGYDGVKGGVITGGATTNGGGGVYVEENGHFVMEGGTIYDCITDDDGGGVYVDTGSKNTSFTMTGGTIYNCRTLDSILECFGGGIYFGDGKLKLSNGTIDCCYTEDDGGGIYSKRGSISLKNMTFSGNKSNERGGAIYIDLDTAKFDGTVFYASNCNFVNNEAHEDGGAFCLRDNPEETGAVMFDRCIFRNNKADEDGGAIHAFDDSLVLSNVEITKNTAGKYGGGVYVDSRYDINVKGVVVIKDNTCLKDIRCSDLCLQDGSFTTARVYSGGLLRGSYISIGSTASGSIKLSKKMSVYEMSYFHAPDGYSIGAKEIKNISVDMAVTSSLFAEGRFKRIIILGCIGLFIIITLIIYRKKPLKG